MSFNQVFELLTREFAGLQQHQIRHAVNKRVANPQKISGRFVYTDSDVEALRAYLGTTSMGWRQQQERQRQERIAATSEAQ